MKTFIVFVLSIFLALFFQATFFIRVKPDLALVIVCFYSLKYGQMKSLACGASAGLLVDAASGFIFGPNILSKSLAGFIMSAFRQQFFQWNALINTAAIMVFSIADILIVRLCLDAFTDMSFGSRPLIPQILQVAYTVFFGFILYPVYAREKGYNLPS